MKYGILGIILMHASLNILTKTVSEEVCSRTRRWRQNKPYGLVVQPRLNPGCLPVVPKYNHALNE